jgi:hypothetical protein
MEDEDRKVDQALGSCAGPLTYVVKSFSGTTVSSLNWGCQQTSKRSSRPGYKALYVHCIWVNTHPQPTAGRWPGLYPGFYPVGRNLKVSPATLKRTEACTACHTRSMDRDHQTRADPRFARSRRAVRGKRYAKRCMYCTGWQNIREPQPVRAASAQLPMPEKTRSKGKLVTVLIIICLARKRVRPNRRTDLASR